jgi:hypothetical protein
MKPTQKQTIRYRNFGRFPKFSIPPELLILREVQLLEMSQRFSVRSRLHSCLLSVKA